MIVGIEGGLGTGKTIIMLRYLLKDYLNDLIIFANLGLKHIKYEKLNVMDIMKNENLYNISIGIDEITVFLDCRRSASNTKISYFILQTRKRNVNLYYTSQSFGMIDRRLLDHTDIRVICRHVYNDDNDIIPDIKSYSIIDCRDLTSNASDINIQRIYVDISKYYKYYDTNEVILPPI
jgi:hypothetical protein